MRLGWTKNKNSTTYRAVKTIRADGKNKTLPIRTFGSDKFICETYGVTDAKAWAKEQVRLMNEAEKEDSARFNIELCAGTDLIMDEQRRFNGGYLFLQDIYYELGLHKICRAVSGRHHFEYDLNDILSRLIYTRILYPSSKRNSFEESKCFIEQPSFELHDIYRALSVLAEESDYIQSRLFKNSAAIQKRNTQVIYYDCTNFYFEIDAAEDDKQFGKSKENRPLPIVGMGLFMDMDGIPISFSIYPVSGMTPVAGPLSFSYSAAYGRGIGNYLQDDNGLGLDAVPVKEAGHLEMVKSLGLTAGLNFAICPKLSANLVYSHLSNWLPENAQPQESQYRYGDYVAANLIYAINKFVSAGVEYDYGHRKSFDGDALHTNRLQLQFAVTF